MPRMRDVRPDLDDADEADDDEISFEVTARDYFMARLAAGRSAAQDALTALDEAIAMCVHPSDDASGKKRKELVDAALEALGMASRSIEDAEDVREEVDPEEGEPWEDGEGDEEEIEAPRAKASRR